MKIGSSWKFGEDTSVENIDNIYNLSCACGPCPMVHGLWTQGRGGRSTVDQLSNFYGLKFKKNFPFGHELFSACP